MTWALPSLGPCFRPPVPSSPLPAAEGLSLALCLLTESLRASPEACPSYPRLFVEAAPGAPLQLQVHAGSRHRGGCRTHHQLGSLCLGVNRGVSRGKRLSSEAEIAPCLSALLVQVVSMGVILPSRELLPALSRFGFLNCLSRGCGAYIRIFLQISLFFSLLARRSISTLWQSWTDDPAR